jgi:hypothetical protein
VRQRLSSKLRLPLLAPARLAGNAFALFARQSRWNVGRSSVELRTAKFSFLPSWRQSVPRSHSVVVVLVALGTTSTSLAESHDPRSSANGGRRVAEFRAPLVAQVLNGAFSNFPEVVRLSDGVGQCSGTFVSTRVIVTAAHCLAGRSGVLSVRALSGPLGRARCEKSPRAGASPLARNGLRPQSHVGERCSPSASGQIEAQCGGAGVAFDPRFGSVVVPGDPRGGIFGPGSGTGGRIPDNALSVEDVRNDLAVCVVDTPVDETETACLDDGRSSPRSMMLVGFGLANRGGEVVDDGRQRSGPVTIRPGPVDGILEGFSDNLSGGNVASSAPGDSGGFVGFRDDRGRLKLRAVVSGGNAIVDGRETGSTPGPRLNPENRGLSAFVDLRSEHSLRFLRDFAARNGVSICGLDGGGSSTLAARSSTVPGATIRPTELPQGFVDPRLAASGLSGFGALSSPVFRFPGSLAFPGTFGFPAQGFGFPGAFGFPGFGFGNPGEQGVVNPAAGGLGFPGAFGLFGVFRNPFLTPRFVRLRNGRLVVIDPFGVGRFGSLGFGRFGSFGGLGFGRFGSFGGLGFGGFRFGGSAFGGTSLAGFGRFDRFGTLPADSLLGFHRFGLLGGTPFSTRFFRLR